MGDAHAMKLIQEYVYHFFFSYWAQIWLLVLKQFLESIGKAELKTLN